MNFLKVNAFVWGEYENIRDLNDNIDKISLEKIQNNKNDFCFFFSWIKISYLLVYYKSFYLPKINFIFSQ